MGKPETGTIHVSVFLTNENALHLVIKDDGEGIDGDKLAQKAVLLGHWTPEKPVEAGFQEKLDLIFAHNSPRRYRDGDVRSRCWYGCRRKYCENFRTNYSFFRKGVGTQFEIDIPTHRPDYSVRPKTLFHSPCQSNRNI